jgi:tetratricopeptide (TPR) repeat protein
MKTLERALARFLRHQAGALELARAAGREEPHAAAAPLFEACLLLCSRDRRDFLAAAEPLRRVAALRKNSAERMHEAAVAAAARGDYPLACRIFDQALGESPRDIVALGVAQVFDHFLGNAAALRSRSARALAQFPPDAQHYHAVLSMHAFALQECGEYAAAEDAAREAAAREPGDLRAWHAVAHVLEMEGRAEQGLRWLSQGEPHWSGQGAASTHLSWHATLLHLQLGEDGRALALYDRRLSGEGLSQLIDRSALLWRLKLEGVDVGGRFEVLARLWERFAEDAHCAFNDMHAMMAFAGARRWDAAHRLLAAQERRIGDGRADANYEMTRLVGLPACRAIAAFGRGEAATAAALLRALPPVAHRVGGSHAQRDILQLTRAAAQPRIRGDFRARGQPRRLAAA